MANPPPYVPSFSFSGFQETNPTDPPPGPMLDNEYDNIADSLNTTITALASVRRSDGALVNGIVTPESLSSDLTIGVQTPTAWVTAKAYTPGNIVVQSNTFYLCLVAHTSGVFATDLAAVKWVSVTLSITGYSADQITYDHAVSGLTAVNVKTALDEIDADLDVAQANIVALTGIGLSSKSGGYTALAADANTVIRFSASATLALTAAATLGAKWACWVLADGGNVLIDPSGVETVNGLATITIPNGCGGLLICTGSAFHLVGGAAGVVAVEETQTSGTDGGAFTSGADRTRTLNTSVRNTIAGASLGSSQVTLPPGTYRCRANAAAYTVDRHRAWLYDTTGAVTLLSGTVEYSPTATPDTTRSMIDGEFTLTVASVLELRHRCQTTKTGNGLGVASSLGLEVYARAVFERVA